MIVNLFHQFHAFSLIFQQLALLIQILALSNLKIHANLHTPRLSHPFPSTPLHLSQFLPPFLLQIIIFIIKIYNKKQLINPLIKKPIPMSTKITHKGTEQLTNITNIKLPKLIFKKVFRVRSASKDKDKCQDKVKVQNGCGAMPGLNGMLKKDGGKGKNGSMEKDGVGCREFSNEKDKRSSSLKLTKIQSKKSLKKKRSTQSSSLQQNEPSTVKPCHLGRIQSNCYQFDTQIQKQHQRNMQKLNHIAKMFDPSTIMKLGKKSSIQNWNNDTNSPKQSKSNNHNNHKMKEHIRITSMVFENKYRERCAKKMVGIDDMEYWKKVNQSLILVAGQGDIGGEIGEVSQEFRDIYETLVTE